MHFSLGILVLQAGISATKLKWSPDDYEFSVTLGMELENRIDSNYVCVTLDWWPDAKCDFGNCSWTGGSVNQLRFDDSLLIDALAKLHGRLRVGGTLSDQVVYQMKTKTDHCQPQFEPIDTGLGIFRELLKKTYCKQCK